MESDKSGGGEDGQKSKVTIPPDLLLYLLFEAFSLDGSYEDYRQSQRILKAKDFGKQQRRRSTAMQSWRLK